MGRTIHWYIGGDASVGCIPRKVSGGSGGVGVAASQGHTSHEIVKLVGGGGVVASEGDGEVEAGIGPALYAIGYSDQGDSASVVAGDGRGGGCLTASNDSVGGVANGHHKILVGFNDVVINERDSDMHNAISIIGCHSKSGAWRWCIIVLTINSRAVSQREFKGDFFFGVASPHNIKYVSPAHTLGFGFAKHSQRRGGVIVNDSAGGCGSTPQLHHIWVAHGGEDEG